jgi:hypothetical protein
MSGITLCVWITLAALLVALPGPDRPAREGHTLQAFASAMLGGG